MHVTESFREQIEARIAQYEKRCSLEFVPVVVRSSGHYGAFRLSLALMVFALASIASSYLILPDLVLSLVEFLLAVGVFVASGWEPVLSRLLPANLKRAEVEEGAALHFLKEEVFATRERTGLLIYVSLLERSVFLFADKGITTKVPEKEWADLGRQLAHDFSRDNPGSTFLQALDEIIARVAADFPPRSDDANELSNRLRER